MDAEAPSTVSDGSAPGSASPRPSAPADDAAAIELVQHAQSGDLPAFNTLVLRHQDAVYGLALRFLGNPQSAEDATQEAFIRAHRAIKSFKGARFRSWLFSIVANASKDELRRQQRRPQRSLDAARDDPEKPTIDPIEPGASPESEAERSDLRRALETALLELPEEWRLTVILSDVHGLAYEEVAESTGVAIGTVKSRLSRARGRLRDILRESGELDDTPRRQGVGR